MTTADSETQLAQADSPAAGRVRRVLGRVATWIGTTAAAAAVGALAGGLAEAPLSDGIHETAATIGYGALLGWPGLFVLLAILRAIWAAWQPRALAAALVEDGGGAPRLAAWLAYLLLGCFALSWATFNAIGLLAGWTTFKPTVIGLAVPPVVVTAVLALAALSRPAVGAIAAGLRALDRRARRRLGRSVLTPTAVLATAAGLLGALVVFGWYVSVRPRIGYLDLEILTHPIAALIGCAIGYQLFARLPARPVRVARLAATAAVAAAIIVALVTRVSRPSEVLKIWARPTIAGEVIEAIYNLEDLREDVTAFTLPPIPRAGARPRDVVLFTIDTVRYDRTPIGGGTAAMPALAALAAQGASFTAAFSPGNVTRRSIPSIASGLSPTRMKGKVAGWALRLDPRHVMLAERFRAAGYDTVGFFCCPSFWDSKHKLGINRGFEHITLDSSGGDPLSATAAAYLAARRRAGTDKPMLLWVHFIDAHNWVPKGMGFKNPEARFAQYDKVLGEVDGYLARITHELPTTGDRAPIIVVTADHGEALGDHKTPYHSTDLYDSQLHVPLVIAGPGISPRRITEPIGLASLAPTLLDLAGFVPPGMPEMDGTSFADLVTGGRTPNPDGGLAYAAMIKDRSAPKNLRAVIRGSWKLIETPSGPELYDRRLDPGELRNVAKTNPAKLAEMQRLLAERKAIDAISPFKP